MRVECQKLRVFCDFCDFFLVGCTPLRENEGRVSKTDGFCAIFGRVHPSGKTRVECQKLGFFCVFGGPETVLKTVLTIRFASYGRFLTLSRGEKRWFQTSLKLEGSETNCFSIHGHPEPSSDGFRGVSEWFQSGPKLCGFRGVPEWSETVWFQRGFRMVSDRVVSEGFQSGFRGV